MCICQEFDQWMSNNDRHANYCFYVTFFSQRIIGTNLPLIICRLDMVLFIRGCQSVLQTLIKTCIFSVKWIWLFSWYTEQQTETQNVLEAAQDYPANSAIKNQRDTGGRAQETVSIHPAGNLDACWSLRSTAPE